MKKWLKRAGIAGGLLFVVIVIAAIAGDTAKGTCAQTLTDGEVCGDELVAFCRERYDPDINAETCEEVFKDEGIDPKTVLADQRADEKVKAKRKEERARTEADVGQGVQVGSVKYKIRSIQEDVDVPVQEYSEPVRAGSGKHLIVVDLDYRNLGKKSIDLLCGGASGFALRDEAGRMFDPDDEGTFSAAANEGTCGDETQPGDNRSGLVVFEVSRSARPTELVVWSTDGSEPADGGKHLVVPVPQ